MTPAGPVKGFQYSVFVSEFSLAEVRTSGLKILITDILPRLLSFTSFLFLLYTFLKHRSRPTRRLFPAGYEELLPRGARFLNQGILALRGDGEAAGDMSARGSGGAAGQVGQSPLQTAPLLFFLFFISFSSSVFLPSLTFRGYGASSSCLSP